MKNQLSFLILFTLLAFSCSEFIEVPVDDKTVELLSPGERAESANYDITFLWERTENALAYRLQIASPTFTDAQFYYADTTMKNNRFEISLEPGNYEWRVKGLNGSTETAYTTRSFTIYESDFEKQRVVLDYPAPNALSSSQEIKLEWQKVYRADQYRLQVDTNNFRDPEELFLDVRTENQSFLLANLDDQQYQWRIQALSGELESTWSESRSFTIDGTPPEKPDLTSPANNQNERLPVTFKWRKVNDAENYELYVYKADSVTLYNSSYPVKTATVSHVFQGGETTERILWRVKAIDRAGNKSEFSQFYSVTVRN